MLYYIISYTTLLYYIILVSYITLLYYIILHYANIIWLLYMCFHHLSSRFTSHIPPITPNLKWIPWIDPQIYQFLLGVFYWGRDWSFAPRHPQPSLRPAVVALVANSRQLTGPDLRAVISSLQELSPSMAMNQFAVASTTQFRVQVSPSWHIPKVLTAWRPNYRSRKIRQTFPLQNVVGKYGEHVNTSIFRSFTTLVITLW